MPRIKQVLTLQRSCLMIIAENMGSLSKNVEDFHFLPMVLLQELIEILEHCPFEDEYLTCIIQPRLKEFKFYRFANATFPMNKAITFASHVCKNLVKVELSDCRKGVTMPSLIQLIRNIPKIEILNLHATKATDQLMGEIGCKCPIIKALDVGSTKITDLGIHKLCVNDSGPRSKTRGLKLLHLAITCTRVTSYGASLALRYLKCLTKLDFDETGTSITNLFDTNLFASQNTFAFQLEYFRHLRDATSSKCLNVVTMYCPNIQKVVLQPGQNDGLKFLLRLKKLKHLQINNVGGLLAFHTGIFPILRIIGTILTELTLSSFPGFDVDAIGYVCPNLQKLVLADIKSYVAISNIPKNSEPFQQLKTFILHIVNVDFPLCQLLSVMKNSINLEYCEIYNCSMLTDAAVFAIIESNSLTCLTQLILRNCGEITLLSIETLIRMDNSLQILEIMKCSKIVESNFFHIEHVVKSQNLDVVVNWSGIPFP